MSTKFLCLLFGVTPLAFSCILNNMISMTVWKLHHHPLACVKFSNPDEMKQFAEMIQLHEPVVNDVSGFMDGLSLTTDCTDETLTQNTYYCGYSCDAVINNVLAFGTDGRVFFCALNFPVLQKFFTILGNVSASTKFALIRDFHTVEMQLKFW